MSEPRTASDAFVPRPRLASTRSILIRRPPSAVWPWLVQIGQDRGGFYSWTALENLFGCRMRNADRIHPEWQMLRVGDPVAIHPRSDPLRVHAIAPPHRLVLVGEGAGVRTSWAFAVDPVDGGTRLTTETRSDWASGGLAGAARSMVWRGIVGPGHALMEGAMLRGVRRRVEGTPDSTSDVSSGG